MINNLNGQNVDNNFMISINSINENGYFSKSPNNNKHQVQEEQVQEEKQVQQVQEKLQEKDILNSFTVCHYKHHYVKILVK